MGHYIIGTAGHVDHGKTALIEALTKVNCDTHKQEKERGITINLGFSHLDLPSGNSFGIIDMPGHKDFIHTMISGANSIDIALLVVAADSGIMPQTTEHLNIIKTLGVQKIIVVLNKCDLVDEELVELASEDIEDLFKSKNMECPTIVPVSSLTHQGIDELIEEIEVLTSQVKEKTSGSTFRMYIDRFFSIKGIGSVVTGSVLSGKVSESEQLILYPQKKDKLKIKGIQRHGKNVQFVKGGDRAALNISGFKAEDYIKGALLINEQVEPSEMIDAQLNIFNEDTQLSLWSTVMFYTGTFESMAKIHLLNKDILKPNETALVQIHLEKPICLFPKDSFIVRKTSSDATIGGGIIIDSKPLHHRKRTQKLLKDLENKQKILLSNNALSLRIENEITNSTKAISLTKLSKTLDSTQEKVKSVLNEVREVLVFSIDSELFLLSESNKNRYETEIISLIKLHHQTFPLLEEGLVSNYFLGKLGLKSQIEKKLLNIILSEMSSKQIIDLYNNTWKLFDHKVKMSEQNISDLKKLEEIYKSYKLQKPIFKDIISASERASIKKNDLKMYLKVLEQQGKLIKYQDDYIHFKIIDSVKNILSEHLKTRLEGINLSEFRQLSTCSKKLIPVLIGILESQKFIKTQPDGEHTNMRLI